MAKQLVIKQVDRVIKETWLNNVKRDYEGCHLLKEDALKASLYFHVRRKLGTKFLEENNLRIFTEFSDGGIGELGYRADIAIVEIGSDTQAYLGDNIKSVIAIIELKYRGSEASDEYFYDDVTKIKSYVKNLKWDCQFYLGFISEKEYCHPFWLDGRQTNKWAFGKLVVLSANLSGGKMKFYMQSCNVLNKDLDS